MNITSKQIQWISNKRIQWVLNKAKASSEIILSKQSITLGSNNLTDTFTITTDSDENLSVISSDTSIATVSLSGNTVTVTAVADGTCMITVKAENSNYIVNPKTLFVNVQLVPTTLNECSWEAIKAKVQSGEASSLWNVGDTKEFTLNGTIEGTTFTNEIIKAKIIGFDHNKEMETNGKSSITFGIANTEEMDIVLVNAKMNQSQTNSGGWNGSYMRDPVCAAFYYIIPSDLKSVITSVTKYSDNTGGGQDIASYVTTTRDKIFILSEYEVFGTLSHANSAEHNYQQQYDYYKDGGSKVRYDSKGSSAGWWLRSVYSHNFDLFVGANGAGGYAHVAFGFAPFFTIVAD